MSFWRNPTTLEVATAQLSEAKVNQLTHKARAEYHSAMAEMLQRRIKRLEETFDALCKVDQPAASRVISLGRQRMVDDEHAEL